MVYISYCHCQMRFLLTQSGCDLFGRRGLTSPSLSYPLSHWNGIHPYFPTAVSVTCDYRLAGPTTPSPPLVVDMHGSYHLPPTPVVELTANLTPSPTRRLPLLPSPLCVCVYLNIKLLICDKRTGVEGWEGDVVAGPSQYLPQKNVFPGDGKKFIRFDSMV